MSVDARAAGRTTLSEATVGTILSFKSSEDTLLHTGTLHTNTDGNDPDGDITTNGTNTLSDLQPSTDSGSSVDSGANSTVSDTHSHSWGSYDSPPDDLRYYLGEYG